ncbi:MAG: trypsin-like peptidase domain-containing protein [Anaerolineae bacterium]|nr:trypsin-like peptidase domain-containing protein [Anaerolineae bacterium]
MSTHRRGLGRLLHLVLLMATWVGGAWLLAGCQVVVQPPFTAASATPAPSPTPVVLIATPTPLPPLPDADLDAAERRIVEVYRRVAPAVVNITTQVLRSDFFFGVYPEEGSGSGFVFDQAGHIVTNYHVVEGARQIVVSFGEGVEMPAQVVGVDPANDLAVLRVEELPEGVLPVPLGDSDELQVGQTAIAIGNPFGQFERTLTVGVISAVNRTLRVDNERVLRGVIQTDASINRGNSGGPLLDSRGRLIGVNTAIYSPTGTSAGVGFAVPVNKVKRVVPVLIERGRFPHPWLGIEGLGYVLYPELAEALGLPTSQGLLIAQAYRDSPAVRAGIRTATREVIYGRRRLLVGGDVLVAIDGVPLRTWEDLDAYLQERAEVGQTVTLTLWRNGRQIELPVVLGEQPS